jgi:DNA-binding NtrC family response regulator
LRERREDIPLLIEHFIAATLSQEYNVEPRRIVPDLEKIVAYPWPGNIRELQNVSERVFALSQSNEITLEDLPSAVSGFEEQPINFQELSELPTLEEMERSLITAALRKSHGNKNEAARLLAIDRQRLYRKIEIWIRLSGARTRTRCDRLCRAQFLINAYPTAAPGHGSTKLHTALRECSYTCAMW